MNLHNVNIAIFLSLEVALSIFSIVVGSIHYGDGCVKDSISIESYDWLIVVGIVHIIRVIIHILFGTAEDEEDEEVIPWHLISIYMFDIIWTIIGIIIISSTIDGCSEFITKSFQAIVIIYAIAIYGTLIITIFEIIKYIVKWVGRV